MSWRRLSIEIFIIAAIGAALGLLGPFGSYELPAAQRFAYWIGFILIGYAIFRPVQTVAIWLAEETAISRWTALLIAGALASLPLTLLIGFALGGMRWDSAYLGAAFPILYAQVAGLGFAILLVMRLLFAERALTAQPPAPPAPQMFDVHADTASPKRSDAPFLDRLPPSLGRDLVCLEMQDHYVKAHTRAGSEMILMRMRDAIAELGDIEGMRVHRSWWVARDAVRGVRRNGRNGRSMQLEMRGGLLVPVARARQADLKRAGWI